jgi:hypothetical protein
VATPALPSTEASRFHGPGTPGLSRAGAALGVIAAGIWVAVGVGFLLHEDRGRLGGTIAMGIACGIGFLGLVARDTLPLRQHAAAFRLGRLSLMLEHAALRSRPSRRPGRTPAAPVPPVRTPRTDATSAENPTRSTP